MQELKQKQSEFNLFKHLIKSEKQDFLNHISYKLIKKNYLQSINENSGYIFEIVEGAVKIGLYSEKHNKLTFEILVSGNFYGSYILKNKAHLDLVKPLTHVKVRMYELNYVKNLILIDSDVAKFFYRISLSSENFKVQNFNN